MLTLAFESSAKAASAALCEDGRLISQTLQCSGLTHSRTLLPMAEDLLKNTGFRIQDIDCFAVAQGPGSFTGIRIGISTVKGLAWAAEKPCVGVSTLAAMAWNGISTDGLICATMDARRSEVYNALFRSEEKRPVRLCEDRAVSLNQLAEELSQLKEPAFLVGDGAELTASFLKSQGIPFVLAPDPLRWQNAWGLRWKRRENRHILPRSSSRFISVCLRRSGSDRHEWAMQKKSKSFCRRIARQINKRSIDYEQRMRL